MDEIGPTWKQARAELAVAFDGSRYAARDESSMVYVVRNEDLLGRNGPTPAMVASGLVSAARTAAIEGSRKGWTANVVAYDETTPLSEVLDRAISVLEDGMITGELIHVGDGHIGKALI